MKLLRYIFSPIWKFWFVLCVAIPFILLFPIFYFALTTKRFDLVFKLKRFWARIISIGTFLYPTIIYQTKKYKLPKPCIVVANHTSYLDIVFCPFYIDHTAIFMGKYELLKIPLFKYFFIYFDIAVNRKSITNAHKAFSDAGKKIDMGLSLMIYPEGTISENGKLRQFKNGAFKLAVEKQIPIVPVVNLNNWHYLQNGGFFKSNGRPGIPEIYVGNPIITKGMTDKDIEGLKEKVVIFTQEKLNNYHGK